MLGEAARHYGFGDRLDADIAARVDAVAGDLTLPACGVSGPTALGEVHFWHCAASLQYEDRHQEHIYATNVEGTANALDLAERIGATAFTYVSTAYVAGKAAGRIPEAPVSEADANNHYEISKVRAEQLVLQRAPGTVRILRPSIVTGHSETRAALNFNGMYGFLRSLVKFKGVMERTQAGLASRMQLQLVVDAEAPLNLVPVDQVAREAVAVALAADTAGVYHLTNPTPPTVGAVIVQMFDLTGICRPGFRRDKRAFTAIDHKFSDRIDFYESYLVGHKEFVRDRTDAVLGTPAAGCALHGEAGDAFYRWYLDHLEQTRGALPVQR